MASDSEDNKQNDKKPNPWESNKEREYEGPPPIDQVVKSLFGGRKAKSASDKAKKAWGKGSGGNGGNSGGGDAAQGSYFNPFFGIAAVVVIILIWAASGIYIVKPPEESVVMRFGKYIDTKGPGPHWLARFVDSNVILNVDQVLSTTSKGLMLTSQENIVSVSFAVKYRIDDPKDYLFNVQNPLNSLNQIIDSAVRQVVGQSTLSQILTVGRTTIRDKVEDNIKALVKKYGLGLEIVDVDMQYAGAPEQVKDAFEDVIKAREDQVTFINQGNTYKNKIVPIAKGNAARITQQAEADKQEAILKAKGDVANYDALLPQYQYAPKVTKERMYLSVMQEVLQGSHVVLVDQKGANSMFYMPLMGNQYQPILHQLPSSSSSSVSSSSSSTPPLISDNTRNMQARYVRWQEAQKQ